MRAYYNEHDAYAAQWLRNLIAAGHIADGDVDERSIEDVLPSDISGYTQCHFFAGIGGWSLALRQAGWPDDRPVWTGSAPCQPFSAAGKGAGVADERHLWPAFHHLIAQCKPSVVFGEQVASRDGLDWLDLVHADMEGTGYAFGSADLCAAGIGAPHIRQRLFFVADAAGKRHDRIDPLLRAEDGGRVGASAIPKTAWCGEPCRLADAEQHGDRCQAEPACHGQPEAIGPADQCGGCGCASGGLADAGCERDEPGREPENMGCAPSDQQSEAQEWKRRRDAVTDDGANSRPGPLNGFWRYADWLYCRDGKWRPVEPGTFPLAHGIPASMGRGKSTLGGMARSNRIIRLRGYGNAIVPELAAEFIRAYDAA